jgi:hypothetical protein
MTPIMSLVGAAIHDPIIGEAASSSVSSSPSTSVWVALGAVTSTCSCCYAAFGAFRWWVRRGLAAALRESKRNVAHCDYAAYAPLVNASRSDVAVSNSEMRDANDQLCLTQDALQ